MGWLTQAIEEIEKREKKQSLTSQVFVFNIRIIEAQAPFLWRKVCESIRNKCNEFNRQKCGVILKLRATSKDKIKVEYRGGQRLIVVKFKPLAIQYAVDWKVLNSGADVERGACGITICEAQAVFVDGDGVSYLTPDRLAEKLLDKVLGRE